MTFPISVCTSISQRNAWALAYEVLAGNTLDKTTLREFLQKIETQYGKDERTVGNAVQRVVDNPTRTMAQALRELEQRFKNQES